MIGEIFEWILFGFFCILGVITTICESKGIFDPAAIKSTPYFYILLDWKTITALAVISGIYVLWKYIGAYGVLIAAGYLHGTGRAEDRAGSDGDDRGKGSR